MKLKYSLLMVLLGACSAPKIAIMDPVAAVKGTLQYQTEIKNRMPEIPQLQAKHDLLQLEVQKMETAKSGPKAIEAKKAEIAKLSKEFSQKFQLVENSFLNNLVQSSLPTLEKFIKEKKVDVLLSPGEAIYVSNNIPNLTNEATMYLNSQLPAVKSASDGTSSSAEDSLQGKDHKPETKKTETAQKEEMKKTPTGAK